MIWLSSFPRSGNTFFRNVLFEVYGLASSSFYEGVGEPENYTDFPFVKTHLVPSEVIPIDAEIKSVYLVRDGRDALISMAHQQIDIYGSERDFKDIFIEAMIAAEGSYFGGWSKNVEDWLERTDLLIRFEDLIKDPIGQIDRVGLIYDLPKKDTAKLPSFTDLKFGKPKYGRGRRVANTEEEELDIIKKSFRKGKAFGWKDELDEELQNLFWSYHGSVMEKLGYTKSGSLKPLNPDFDYQIMKLLGHELPKVEKKFTVLIEANKLLMHQNDGVKRYLLELLKFFYPVTQNKNSRWQIDVYLKGRIYPLQEFGGSLFDVSKNENHYDRYSTARRVTMQFIHASWSRFKSLFPNTLKDKIKQYYKKGLMKMGLRFSSNTARFFYFKEKLKFGKKADRASQKNDKAQLTIEDYDLVHVPLPQHYEPFKETSANFFVTVHDLTHRLFSDYHTENNVQKAEDGLNYFMNQNAHFLCISESTKKDFKELFPVKEDSLFTIYEAADTRKFKPNLFKESDLITRGDYNIPEKPFLFTLSTLEPRKNLINTIKAFDLLLDENPGLDCNLVIGGKNGWKSKDLLQLRHQNNIVFTGFVDENDLPVLYNEAEALCYVSYYEGFGLPPLEAMSCRTPVIYGNNSSMKELFEGYGLGADPDDVNNIKEQMRIILTQPDVKKELANKALKRSLDFSWRKTAIETLDAYEQIIEKTKAKRT